MKVYLTGPISNALYSEESDWRIACADRLRAHGIDCAWGIRLRDYDSFRGSSAKEFENRKSDPSRFVMLRDRQELATSDVVLVNFEESPHQPALGACIEIGQADAWGIPVVAAVAYEGVHDHLAVIEACTHVFGTLAEAEAKVASMAHCFVSP